MLNSMKTFVFASIGEMNSRMLAPSHYLAFGVCGVAVAELIDMGRLKFDGKHVSLSSSASAGDHFLDEICAFIGKKKSGCRLDTLISSIHNCVKHPMKKLTESLEDNGHIRIEQYRFLGLIPYRRYMVSRVAQHQKLVKELKEIVLKGDKGTDAGKAFMITILNECGVYRRLFSRDEYKQARETIKLIQKGDYFDSLDETRILIQKSVRNVIAASQAVSS